MKTAILVPQKGGSVDVLFFDGLNLDVEKAVFGIDRGEAARAIAECGATIVRQIAQFPIAAEYEVSTDRGAIKQIRIKSKAKNRKAQLTMMTRGRWYVACFDSYDAIKANEFTRTSNATKSSAVFFALNWIEKGNA